MRRWFCLVLLAALSLCPCAQASEALTVAAKGAVLIDGASGLVLFGQNENKLLPEASCTKIMTALLALEHSELSEPVTAGKNARGVSGTSIYLSEGETLTMEQMLYGLMLRSGNDAAVAIAEHVAGSVPEFANMANTRARELDADAHFVNPHGLDAEGHAASALGLARIMRAAMEIPEFRTITGTKRKIIPWVGNEYSRVLENKNRLLSTYEGATGGKTGFTSKAGRCLVFSAERDDMELIGCVLNCYTWFDTATVMLDYGFEHFRPERSLAQGQVAARVSVLDGNTTLSLIYQVIALLIGLILPRLILQQYGSQINGLVTSITQMLSVIIMLDLGVGAVVQSALYSPLARNDSHSISVIYCSAKKYFNVIVKTQLKI